jgi:hypothetical protein
MDRFFEIPLFINKGSSSLSPTLHSAQCWYCWTEFYNWSTIEKWQNDELDAEATKTNSVSVEYSRNYLDSFDSRFLRYQESWGEKNLLIPAMKQESQLMNCGSNIQITHYKL